MNIREPLGMPRPVDQQAWESNPLRGALLEELMETFLAEQKVKFSQTTYEARVTNLKKFRAFLRENQVSKPGELTPQLIRDYEKVRTKYFRVWGSKPVCQRTLRQDTISLRVFLRDLYEKHVLLVDLCSVLNKIHAKRSLPRPLSPATIKEWFSLCDLKKPKGIRDRAVFELIYGSGLRSGEAMALNITDIDLAQKQVIVQQTKNHQGRIVPMTRLSVHYLNRYISEVRPWMPRSPKTESYLWLSGHGRAYTKKKIRDHVRKRYRPQVDSEVPITLHGLRHSFATHMLQAGASVRHVQEMLGHQCVNSTQIYTQVAIKDLKEVHRRFHPRR